MAILCSTKWSANDDHLSHSTARTLFNMPRSYAFIAAVGVLVLHLVITPIAATPDAALPIEVVPVDAAPVGTGSVEVVPDDAVPVGTGPVDAASVDTVPDDSLPVEAVAGGAVAVDPYAVNPLAFPFSCPSVSSRSGRAVNRWRVDFIGSSRYNSIRVYWCNFRRQPVEYALIRTRGWWTVNTALGHVWVFVNANRPSEVICSMTITDRYSRGFTVGDRCFF